MELGKRTTLKNLGEADEFARERKPFKTSRNRVFARTERSGLYVVYSWGTHWPLYIYDDSINQWYGCNEKYSVSTSNHARKAQPVRTEQIEWCNNACMGNIVSNGTALKRITEKVLA